MAFTREFIRNAAKESGVEIPKELENALIDEHITTRDAFADERVKADREKNKPEPAPAVKDTQEYKNLKKKFDDYKVEIAAKETKAAKEAAVRAYYQGKNITGEALDVAMRGSGAEIEALELGDDGKIKDTGPLDSLVSGIFAGLVSTTTTQGAPTATPPVNTGGNTMTREQIFAIKDPAKCQEAIAANMDLFTRRE